MRVIAGSARGIRLRGPEGQSVRPTLDRVRESLFNILAPRIESARFLDLFAGTGAIGIEALSRGAAFCCFVDASSSASRLIRDNLQRTKLEDRAAVITTVLPQGLTRIREYHGVFELIYIDPPREFTEHAVLLQDIVNLGLTTSDGLVVLERRGREETDYDVTGLTETRTKRYGNTKLLFFIPSASG